MSTNVQNHSVGEKRLPVKELRQRIHQYIKIGGLYPISPCGILNIARRFYTTPELVRKLIAEESAKIGKEAELDLSDSYRQTCEEQPAPPYIRKRCWCKLEPTCASLGYCQRFLARDQHV